MFNAVVISDGDPTGSLDSGSDVPLRCRYEIHVSVYVNKHPDLPLKTRGTRPRFKICLHLYHFNKGSGWWWRGDSGSEETLLLRVQANVLTQ